MVLHVDPENERFSLGIKQLLEDPWDVINSKYNQGVEAEGKVTKKVGNGYLVELEPGVEGLLPGAEVKSALETGAKVNVKIKTADQKEKKFILQCEK
jgi:ribosomal protein S1